LSKGGCVVKFQRLLDLFFFWFLGRFFILLLVKLLLIKLLKNLLRSLGKNLLRGLLSLKLLILLNSFVVRSVLSIELLEIFWVLFKRLFFCVKHFVKLIVSFTKISTEL